MSAASLLLRLRLSSEFSSRRRRQRCSSVRGFPETIYFLFTPEWSGVFPAVSFMLQLHRLIDQVDQYQTSE
ncbi:Hypothetical protein SMAX5B_009247 [Scophthalmus maximus]|uniref:Uncharacterized protein n=1 Tax=Scophthalmus maximus TaxID=52904 RepID=A0A2U9C5U9_SCOMX|nr:Hypothetical protein SMAX5B_009247 [Scophthalmus maximus]